MDKADLNDDGVLDTDELYLHISGGLPNVLRRAGLEGTEQTPQLYPPVKSNNAWGIAARDGDELTVTPR